MTLPRHPCEWRDNIDKEKEFNQKKGQNSTEMARFKLGMASQLFLILVIAILAFQSYWYLAFHLSNKLTAAPPPIHADDVSNPVRPVDNSDLVWFVQATDLHLSKFSSDPRASELKALCRFMAEVIRPMAIVVSGDLTDAKEKNFHGSRQYEEEWVTYRGVIEECQRLHVGAKWLDLRGNHDTFGVMSDSSPENFYKSYSSQGAKHPRSYRESVEFGQNKTVGFVAIDASLSPGLKRPFNFFGVLDQQEITAAKALLSKAKEENDYVVVFGHYPTSSVSSYGGENLREFLSDELYLCGHFHTVFGAVEDMYTRHSSGLVELELGDWKTYRRYRIGAFDQGLFSFTDRTFDASDKNVAVLVTNPKDVKFLLSREKLSDVVRSKEIRVLVFSDDEIESVSVTLPDQKSIQMKRQTPDILYTSPWQPEKYLTGLHKLTIDILFKDGTRHTESHLFSLDGHYSAFRFLPRLILMMDWLPFSQVGSVFFACATVVVLTTVRLCHLVRLERLDPKFRLSSALHGRIYLAWMSMVRKVWLLCSLLYWPLVSFVAYPYFLPWAIGYVLPDKLGILFGWGTFIMSDLTYLPPDSTFVFAALQSLLLTWPFMLVLALALDRTYLKLNEISEVQVVKPGRGFYIVVDFVLLIWRHLGFCVLLSCFSFMTWTLYCTYGLPAVFSPWGLGSVIFVCWLYHRAVHIRLSDIGDVVQVWPLPTSRSSSQSN